MIADTVSKTAPQQLVVPGTAAIAPPRTGCLPILKWAGGKRWLAPIIAPGIYERLAVTGGRYIEPFLGGAAIALDLGLPNMILSDVCKPLVEMYHAICKAPGSVSWSLQVMIDQGINAENYYAIRAASYPNRVRAAARMIYINKLGYNGLYRENKRGQINVPFGKSSNGSDKRSLPSPEELVAVAAALAKARITTDDFRVTIEQAQRGDVVYADPPYLGTFSGYSAGGFDDDEHVALAAVLQAAHERGAVVIASNSDNERVRALYDWAFVTPVEERHVIGATGARRGKRPAVLIVSDETILKGS
jgi:DNA adenine methylase